MGGGGCRGRTGNRCQNKNDEGLERLHFNGVKDFQELEKCICVKIWKTVSGLF